MNKSPSLATQGVPSEEMLKKAEEAMKKSEEIERERQELEEFERKLRAGGGTSKSRKK